MAGLSASRNTPAMGAGAIPVRTSYPIAASTKVYKGSLVCLNSGGYLVPGDQSAALVAVGMCDQDYDNSSGGNAAAQIECIQGVFRWDNGNSITLSSVGSLLWVVDDHTVSSSSSGATAAAGTCYAVDSIGVWTAMWLESVVNGTSLTTFEGNLASSALNQGASLVGINDAGALIAATTVEGALQELVKKANADLSLPLNTQVITLSTVTSGPTLYSFCPPTAGKILRLDAFTVTACSTTAKAATFTVAVSGVATSATLALTSTACNTAANAVTGATATTAPYSAGQTISISASSVTSFVEGTVILQLYVQSA